MNTILVAGYTIPVTLTRATKIFSILICCLVSCKKIEMKSLAQTINYQISEALPCSCKVAAADHLSSLCMDFSSCISCMVLYIVGILSSLAGIAYKFGEKGHT